MKNFHLILKVVVFFIMYSVFAYRESTYYIPSGFYYNDVGLLPTLALVAIFLAWMILGYLQHNKNSQK